MSYNKIIVIGNLTKDPEMKAMHNGGNVTEIDIAINHRYTANGEKKEEVCFVKCVAFGKLGEVCNQYLAKGKKALFEGRLQQQRWEIEGKKNSRHQIVLEKVEFLSQNEKKDQKGEPYDIHDPDYMGETPW